MKGIRIGLAGGLVLLAGAAYWLLQARVPNVAGVALVGVGFGVCLALLLASFWRTK